MPGVFTLINAPAFLLRVFLNMSTGAAGVSVIAASVSVVVIVVKILGSQNQVGDPFHDTRIIFQSRSSLAFNRMIQSYEMDAYYNATQTLLDLTEQLNSHLKRKFPDRFVKISVSGFSLSPERVPTKRRKRRNEDCCQCLAEQSSATGLGANKCDGECLNCRRLESQGHTSPCGCSGSTTPTTSAATLTTSSTFTTTIKPTDETTTAYTTNFSESVTSTTSDTDSTSSNQSQSSETSPNTLYTTASTTSFFPSLTPTFTSNTPNTYYTTTALPTTSDTNNTTYCDISIFNGTNRTSVIYLKGTLYFNTTNDSMVEPVMIINALRSFNPIIVLADKCLKKSPDKSDFNAKLSKVEPPSVVHDASFLAKENSIASSLLNEVQLVISPAEKLNNSTTTTLQSIITIAPALTTTTAIPTSSTTTVTTEISTNPSTPNAG